MIDDNDNDECILQAMMRTMLETETGRTGSKAMRWEKEKWSEVMS